MEGRKTEEKLSEGGRVGRNFCRKSEENKKENIRKIERFPELLCNYGLRA